MRWKGKYAAAEEALIFLVWFAFFAQENEVKREQFTQNYSWQHGVRAHALCVYTQCAG